MKKLFILLALFAHIPSFAHEVTVRVDGRGKVACAKENYTSGLVTIERGNPPALAGGSCEYDIDAAEDTEIVFYLGRMGDTIEISYPGFAPKECVLQGRLSGIRYVVNAPTEIEGRAIGRNQCVRFENSKDGCPEFSDISCRTVGALNEIKDAFSKN